MSQLTKVYADITINRPLHFVKIERTSVRRAVPSTAQIGRVKKAHSTDLINPWPGLGTSNPHQSLMRSSNLTAGINSSNKWELEQWRWEKRL